MKTKGQTWAEYIVILAVATLFAGIAMYMAGSFMGNNKQISERDSASYWFSTDVGITRYYINSSMAQLLIKNNKNFRINVTGITSQGFGNLVAPGGANSVVLDPGQSVQVNVTGLNCFSGSYSLPLTINYTDVNYGAKYSLQGEKSLVGTCMGSSALQCSSNSQCGTTPCQANACYNATYIYNYAAIGNCNNICSGGSCQSCSCTTNPTTCGTTTIYGTCPTNYCNTTTGYLCTYTPPSCSNTCSGGTCVPCTPPACGAPSCASCGSGQTCQNGQCITLTCGTDCTFGGNGICNTSCSGGTCSNFIAACNNIAKNTNTCSNSTGGTSGPLNFHVSCCNGTANDCGNLAFCDSSTGNCTDCPAGYGNCDLNPANGCEVALNSNNSNCGSCGHACSGGQACVGGICQATIYYQSSTNLCGYYTGSSASCISANTFCTSGNYYPSQSCSSNPTYNSCQAETTSASCAVCGNCAGGSDTCSAVACGTTNSYGCSNMCKGGGTGASYCVAASSLALGASCNCNQVCASGLCSGGVCQTYRGSTTNLCGYYSGSSSSCSSNPATYCTTGNYYPSQSCTTGTSSLTCSLETASASCAVCGNCAGGSDTCSAVACGTTNSYGCGSGRYCSGGKGTGSCNARFGTGAACNCSAQCTSGTCRANKTCR